MQTARLARIFNLGLAARVTEAAQFCSAYSVYPPAIVIPELTTAQAFILSMYHSLLQSDAAVVRSLLHLVPALPQLQSSSVAVWLLEDFCFRREDVAKVLSSLAQFIHGNETVVPLHLLVVFTGLEEKYEIFELFLHAGDTVGQKMLARLNPPNIRASQMESDGSQDQSMEARPERVSVATQTNKEELPVLYTISQNVESVPTETASEFKHQDSAKPDNASGTISQSLSPTNEFKCQDSVTPDSASGISQSLSPTSKFQKPEGDRSRPSPSAPPLHAFYSMENGKETPASNIEPIYQNISTLPEQVAVIRPAASKTSSTSKDPSTAVNWKSRSYTRPVLPKSNKATATKKLMKAAEKGDIETSKEAIAEGASIEHKDNFGRTPLHLAVVSSQHYLVQILLESGADKNIKDSLGRTPLHYTALRGRVDCAWLLLASGADPNIRDNSGMTAMALATIKHHSGIIALLKKKGGQECTIS